MGNILHDPEEKQRLEVFQRLAEDPDIKLSVLVTEIGIPYPKLLKIRKDFREANNNGTLHELLNVDRLVFTEVIDQIKEKVVTITDDEEDVEAIEGELMEAVEKLDGLQLLNKEVQDTALTLIGRLQGFAKDKELDPKEVNALVESLTKIQTAFFNRGQVNIFNSNGSNHPLAEFRGLMGD